jgi:hypothetical protein
MRKPVGQFACRRECASSFRLELALVLVVLLVLAAENEDETKNDDEAGVEHWALSVER